MRTLQEAWKDTLEPWSQPWVQTTTWVGVIMAMFAAGWVVMGEAHDAAKQTSDMSNANQIATALSIYASDNNDRLPPALVWQDAIHDYAKNDQFFRSSFDRQGSPQTIAFGFNKALAERILSEIPAATPLILVQHGTGPNALADPSRPYIVRRKIALATVEIKARLLTPVEFARLTWTPPASKP